MADENEDQLSVKGGKSSADQKSDAFGIDIPGEDEDTKSEKEQDLKDKGGEEGVDLDEGRESLDPETSVDDLAEGATGADSDTPLSEALGISPPDNESESDSDSESNEEPADDQEPETDQQAEADDSELDPELVDQLTSDSGATGQVDQKLVEKVKEEPVEVAKNLQQWQKKLTERSQALSDVEKLQQIYKVASQDIGRAEAFQDFVSKMADGRFDSDRELDEPDIPIPENVEGSEYEETFETLRSTIKQQHEEMNRMKRMLNQQHRQNGGSEGLDDLIGQTQEEAATGSQAGEISHQESVQEFEQFIEKHPGLVDENGEPTPQLKQITDYVAEYGVAFEDALYANFGEDLIENVKKSVKNQTQTEEETTKRNPDSSELVDESVEGSSDQSEASKAVESFMGTSSLESAAKSLRERASS